VAASITGKAAAASGGKRRGFTCAAAGGKQYLMQRADPEARSGR
jgi:hypothetical protein